MKPKVLWIDDEISGLKSLIYFLENEGYEVETVSNGTDALEIIKTNNLDAVFLDEYMPGLDGIETLNLIREISYSLPVVMITKSEENSLIDSALSERVDDYLIKPVNPKQLLATLKKLLNKQERIRHNVGRNYAAILQKINAMLAEGNDFKSYAKIHHLFNLWNLNINRNIENDMINMHEAQKVQVNEDFIRFVTQNYTSWIRNGTGPVMSHTFMDKFIIPRLKNESKVFFLLIDCMRYDHYLLMETFLNDYFNTVLDYYYSIIPTATPYSRNSLFSGMLPLHMSRNYPEKWDFFDTESQNQHEEFFLRRKLGMDAGIREPGYAKVSTNDQLKRYIARFKAEDDKQFNSLVVNIMDVFTHFRSESHILKDMLPDENSLLAFVSTWFRTSGLLEFISMLVKNDYTVVITSDHGSIISKEPLEIETGKDVSVNLKYKFGSSVRSRDKRILVINEPEEYGLSAPKKSDRWYIATGNGYLVYSTKYNQYKREYYNTFQHGGISMEEMIMPVGILGKKNV